MDGTQTTCGPGLPVSELLSDLTPAQREAVSHREGPLLILAGPGSGKTRVITHRVACLVLEGVAPHHVVAVTFTNKAADEMRTRLDRLIPGRAVWVSTFHRFCARLLRQYASLVGLSENFSIYDTEDSSRLLAKAVAEARLNLSHVPLEHVSREISRAKSNLVTAHDFVARPGQTLGSLLTEVYPLYQRKLLAANAVDFDDLLLHVAQLLRDAPELRRALDERFRFILVDEYQDTNFAQYAIVRALSQDYPNLAVTGDPDQSIYGWRGANLDNILKFEHDYPSVRVVRLERNYRSTKSILRVADQLISNNVRRRHKSLFTENAEGRRVRLVKYASSHDEAEDIAAQIARDVQGGLRRPRDFAVCYRVNWLSRSLEAAIRNAGVPYQIVRGLEFYQRKEIKDVLAYLQLVNNPRNDVAFLRIINTPPRSIGKTTIGRLTQHAAARKCSLLDAARNAGLIEGLNPRAAVHVAKFVADYDRMGLNAASPLHELLASVLTESGYDEWLRNSPADEDHERLANIDELLTAAREFDEKHVEDNRLEAFLEQTALVSDTDDWDAAGDRVSLMTLHSAKGLEFPVVHIAGVEQGLLPHERSREDAASLEEERRLLFVGITRAQCELQLSYTDRRSMRGAVWPAVPSPFLMELPRGEMDLVQCGATPATTPFDDEASALTYEPVYPDCEEEIQQPRRQARRRSPAPRVMTAAQLLPDAAADRPLLTPDEYSQGMMINHPIHGLGKIVAVAGAGSRRTATVQFFAPSREVKFVLQHGNLQPIESAES